jgi:hypothetical protein
MFCIKPVSFTLLHISRTLLQRYVDGNGISYFTATNTVPAKNFQCSIEPRSQDGIFGMTIALENG